MGLSILAAFAVSVWIVLTALGAKSFDGLLLGLAIMLVGFGVTVVQRKLRRDEPAD